MGAPLWTPPVERSAGSQLAAFAAYAGIGALDLHEWSVTEPERFWRLVWDWCGVVGVPGDGPALTTGGHLTDGRPSASAARTARPATSRGPT
jgi:acetoacetyl-CoA synthetase